MKLLLYYHGTTLAAAQNILENGFDAACTIWNCSNPLHTYLVAADDENRNREEAIRFAGEAAQIAAAVSGTSCTDIVIFEFDIPDEVADDWLSPDISCVNTDGCWSIENADLNRLLTNNSITMAVKRFNNAYVPYLRIFYLLTLDESYINIKDKDLWQAMQNLKKRKTQTDWFYDDYLFSREYEYDEMPDVCQAS